MMRKIHIIAEALTEGWSVCIPAADISWMRAAIEDIVDIPVSDQEVNDSIARSGVTGNIPVRDIKRSLRE